MRNRSCGRRLGSSSESARVRVLPSLDGRRLAAADSRGGSSGGEGLGYPGAASLGWARPARMAAAARCGSVMCLRRVAAEPRRESHGGLARPAARGPGRVRRTAEPCREREPRGGRSLGPHIPCRHHPRLRGPCAPTRHAPGTHRAGPVSRRSGRRAMSAPGGPFRAGSGARAGCGATRRVGAEEEWARAGGGAVCVCVRSGAWMAGLARLRPASERQRLPLRRAPQQQLQQQLASDW